MTANMLRTPKDFERALKEMQERAEACVGAGLYLVANNIMGASKELVPHDTGTLSRSGYVTLPKIENGKPVVELGYDGFAAAYAVVQHENESFNHPEGRMAKYLKIPFDDAAPNVQDNVIAFAKAAFERGQKISLPPSNLPQNPYVGSLQPHEAGKKARDVGKLKRMRSRIKKLAKKEEAKELKKAKKKVSRMMKRSRSR